MLIVWGLVFIVSLALLIKGTDWLVESSESIWEGSMFLVIYILFIAKLFSWF